MQNFKPKNISVFLLLAFILYSSFFIPVFAHAQPAPSVSTLIPCNGPDCGFGDLLKLFRNVIDYIIKFLVIPGATISFAVAGFKILTNPDNSAKRTEARKSMVKVAIGLVVLLAAWLIVKTILSVFLNEAVLGKIPINF